ncbi:UvrD-helicase domain-containing protein [Polaromonas sp. P5_D5]
MATQALIDVEARRAALMAHDRTLLVEAGAGSGKTAVLAGRIAMMIVQGIAPKSIAAVTFTELAASELLFRVREFVARLRQGNIPQELRLVIPDQLSEIQLEHLAAADAFIDDITCSTIHGFCQRLIAPYPVEANIDPGASVMDPDQAKLVFIEIVQEWLREQLNGDANGLLAELVMANPGQAVALVNVIVKHQRENEGLQAPAAPSLAGLLSAFQAAAAAYSSFITTAAFVEENTAGFATMFATMAADVEQLDSQSAAGLVAIVISTADSRLCTANGSFKVYKFKGKWVDAAKAVGRSKVDGEALNTQAEALHQNCGRTWSDLLAGAACQALHDLMPLLQPAVERMQQYKRSAALLDFDDLLRSARNLLRAHPMVRAALADRYRHVLVDEFQDTDPVQTEIFWRLCGSPPTGVADGDWQRYCIRRGALFLVGDPKQAIYRFRGADVNAYVWARDAFQQQDAASVVSISVNFRSCAPILQYVNEKFSGPLTAAGQPGFTALDSFHPARENGLSVAALDVTVANEQGRASATEQRDAEAEAVANLCEFLIGREQIVDPDTREGRTCRAGDIALLAPTGADLWRYEQALEDRGIAVATQAGKGLFRRQEIQDLLAITRVLTDSRDTLALGALLRGPLVGIPDEELLDIIWSLRDADDQLPALSLRLDVERVEPPLVQEVLRTLQALRQMARGTTPHNLLSQAVDALRVRPALIQRCGRQAERSLANVDLFLDFSRAYDVRGLAAFSEAMTAAWEDESRAVEGRPDAQEESVALYSMHAAKGLEWPVVIPINATTLVKAPDKDVVVRGTNTLYCPVLGVAPTGHDTVVAAEKDELERERVRLWYVASTRARELMIVPRSDVVAGSTSWAALVDLGLPNLPNYDLPQEIPPLAPTAEGTQNLQTRDVFSQEAAAISALKRQIAWISPSRNEDPATPLIQVEAPVVVVASLTGKINDSGLTTYPVQGGRERGLVLHKLLEEVLTGETLDDVHALTTRVEALAAMLGVATFDDPSKGLSSLELASTTRRALALEAVAAVRDRLVPEFGVFSAKTVEGKEHVTTGVADAIAFSADGSAEVVIDWKSDVAPGPEAIAHYERQVRAYMEITGTPTGLIVFATPGMVHQVTLAAA